jgi:thiol-disulfide isomerase/thioredoxin
LLVREPEKKMVAEKAQPGAARARLSTALWAAGIAALAGFVSVYVTLGRPDNAVRPAARAVAPSAGAASGPLNRGQMAAFVFRKAPEELPEVKFLDADSKEKTLADWSGKVVLLNLWATWCLPCRKEMPALDRLQRELGSDKFQVVAVSVDRAGLAGARKFLDEAKASNLALYADPSARMAAALRAAGLPATLLLDGRGREIGRLLGPAEWDSEDAKRLIAAALP